MRTSRLLPALLVACCLYGTHAPAQALSPDGASVFLPARHWAVDAARGLALRGLTPRRFGWGDGSLTSRDAGAALRDAAAAAEREAPELAPLARGYWARFVSEFPATAAALGAAPTPRFGWGEGSLTLGHAARRGQILPGTSRPANTSKRGQARAFAPDLAGIAGEGVWAKALAPNVAVGASPRFRDGSWLQTEAVALATWRAGGVWAGRRAVGFGPAVGGGVVFDAAVPVNGVGAYLNRPIILPWLLRHLGPLRGEGLFARLDSSAKVGHPLLFAGHFSFSPHPRVLIGGTHGSMFGGHGVGPLDWQHFSCMALLGHAARCGDREYENQISSLELRYRTPWAPLSVYAESGADDSEGAWKRFPGIVIGAQLTAVPGMPGLSGGVEYAYFSDPCLGCHFYSTWYQHYVFRGGWAADGVLLGHPLGGDGKELSAHATLEAPEARLRLAGRLFARRRGPYNILAPAHAGRSIGGTFRSEFRAAAGLDAVLEAAAEVAAGPGDWRQGSVLVGLRYVPRGRAPSAP